MVKFEICDFNSVFSLPSAGRRAGGAVVQLLQGFQDLRFRRAVGIGESDAVGQQPACDQFHFGFFRCFGFLGWSGGPGVGQRFHAGNIRMGRQARGQKFEGPRQHRLPAPPHRLHVPERAGILVALPFHRLRPRRRQDEMRLQPPRRLAHLVDRPDDLLLLHAPARLRRKIPQVRVPLIDRDADHRPPDAPKKRVLPRQQLVRRLLVQHLDETSPAAPLRSS